MNAMASNPAHLKVNVLTWLRCKPTWPLIWAGLALVCVVAALFIHWLFWIAAGLMVLCNVLYWANVRIHYWQGDANPGLVVSEDPLLVATATDLRTTDVVSFPVVKIIEAPGLRIEGQPAKLGARLATVSMYGPDTVKDGLCWKDFDPLPAPYATQDMKQLNRLMQTFRGEDWARLEQYLKRVPQPYQVGLYHIETESDAP